jgi:hypothetical protein
MQQIPWLMPGVQSCREVDVFFRVKYFIPKIYKFSRSRFCCSRQMKSCHAKISKDIIIIDDNRPYFFKNDGNRKSQETDLKPY